VLVFYVGGEKGGGFLGGGGEEHSLGETVEGRVHSFFRWREEKGEDTFEDRFKRKKKKEEG